MTVYNHSVKDFFTYTKNKGAGMRWTHVQYPHNFLKSNTSVLLPERLTGVRLAPSALVFFELLRSAIRLQFPAVATWELYSFGWTFPFIFCNLHIACLVFILTYMIFHCQRFVIKISWEFSFFLSFSPSFVGFFALFMLYLWGINIFWGNYD